MKDIQLSIIIPVYNVEDYLAECLDSVFIGQDVSSYEVICVNDGSTDGSRTILEQYKYNYSELIIIDQENKGLPAARNSGFKIAKGDFIYFLDSDDFLFPGSLSKMLQYALERKLDLCFFNVLKDGFVPYFHLKKQITEVLSGIKIYKQNYNTNGFFPPSAVWTHLYKRELLANNRISFKEGIEHEDEEFTPRAYFFAKRASCLDIAIQHHRIMRRGSVTEATYHQLKEQNLRDILQTNADLYKFFTKMRCDEKIFFMKIFENYLAIARLIYSKNPSLKRKLFNKHDYNIMKDCIRGWEWYAYYWMFRYSSESFKWYINSNTSTLLKKAINKGFKFYYRLFFK